MQTADEEALKHDVARRLVALRNALGLKQKELLERIDYPQNTYSQYENGKRLLSIEVATKLCDEFGVTLDYIFRGARHTLPADLAARLPR